MLVLFIVLCLVIGAGLGIYSLHRLVNRFLSVL